MITKRNKILVPSNPSLTSRWFPLRPHPAQIELIKSPKRFKVVPAGRRSGKSERAKRMIARECMYPRSKFANPRYFCGAPTRDQAKKIFWKDFKQFFPDWFIVDKSETELYLLFRNGVELHVVGLDKPERIEGQPWDGCVIDEIANVKKNAWNENIRPALSDRQGFAWLIGVPEGRNHYYKMYQRALPQTHKSGLSSEGVPYEWGAWTWKSADILPPEEIAAARNDLDERTFKQEYEADFVTFSGRAYYNFTPDNYVHELLYDPHKPLCFSFDFNVSPGVAVVSQEQEMPGQIEEITSQRGIITRQPVQGTGVIGEVWIPQNSNTLAVCRKLYNDWKRHQGTVKIYGDATGGSRKTSALSGSDWDIIKDFFEHTEFKDRLKFCVPRSNPSEKSRVGDVNRRCKSISGIIRLMVDADTAPHIIEDLEGVTLLEGGSGEIDKKHDHDRTHISDALGYMIAYEFPYLSKKATVQNF